MKYLLKTVSLTSLLFCLNNCTAYVDPHVSTPATSTTTTTRTASDPYFPGGSVTTEKRTTTTNY